MKHLIPLFFGLIFYQMNEINAQDLSSHQWEHRLVLIQTNDTNNLVYKKQLKELETHISGLKERKIIVYHFNDDVFKKGLLNKKVWHKHDYKTIDKYFKNSNSEFKIVLVGLDGGIKLKQSTLLKSKELFSTIDVMPMRIQEMRNSKRN